MRLGLAMYFAVVVASVTPIASGGTQPASPSATMHPAARVIAALLGSVHRDAADSMLVVRDSTLRFTLPARPTMSRWRASYDSFPERLVRALARESERVRSIHKVPLPRRFHPLSTAEQRAIFAGGVDRGWREFERRFPGVRAFYQFSPVVFNADSSEALIYYHYHCGGLCGGGSLVLVRREGATWRVRQILQFWIS